MARGEVRLPRPRLFIGCYFLVPDFGLFYQMGSSGLDGLIALVLGIHAVRRGGGATAAADYCSFGAQAVPALPPAQGFSAVEAMLFAAR